MICEWVKRCLEGGAGDLVRRLPIGGEGRRRVRRHLCRDRVRGLKTNGRLDGSALRNVQKFNIAKSLRLGCPLRMPLDAINPKRSVYCHHEARRTVNRQILKRCIVREICRESELRRVVVLFLRRFEGRWIRAFSRDRPRDDAWGELALRQASLQEEWILHEVR